VLDDLAHQHEDAFLAGTARLRHVVGDDEDRVLTTQFPEQLLDRLGALRVERRTRLVHQQQLRLHRQQARDAQLLLLFERQLGGLALEAVLDLVPQQHRAQRLLDDLVGGALVYVTTALGVQTMTEKNIVANRNGQRIGR
jgi:hypothetical protein